MRMRRLGGTGLAVGEVGLGLWGMGGWSGSDDRSSLSVLTQAADMGCTFYDSAWAYGDGRSDSLLGRLLRERPASDIVAASKVPPADGMFPASPSSRFTEIFPDEHVRHVADNIRRAVGVDCIPLLQLHVWDDHWAADPAFRRLVERLKEDAVVRHFGISLNRWEPSNGLAAIRTGLVDTVQVIYNVFDQAPEDELLPACSQANVGVIARVPLDEGSLGGTFTLDTRFPAGDWRSRYFGPENLGPTVERVEALKRELPVGLTLPALGLRFILSDERVSTVIVGMRSIDHLRENIAAADAGPLTPDVMAMLRRHRWDRVPAPWSD
jgi:aryl-alcohol dehydrogenase-like predicted oxidoreductase